MKRGNHTRDQVEYLARRMVGEVWNEGKLDVLDEIASEDYTEYDPVLPGKVRGREAFKEVVAMFREPMPDLFKHIEGLWVDGNTVIVHYRATGTQKGEMMGLPPTGKKVEGQGVFIFTIEDGKIVSGIDMWDAYGVLRQLGAFEGEPA